jgi:hypothetical protein
MGRDHDDVFRHSHENFVTAIARFDTGLRKSLELFG